MTDAVQIALLVIGALLVGALIPLILSASALLRQTRQTLRRVEARVDEVGTQAQQVLTRADQIAAALQEELPTLRRTSARLDELGGQVERLTQTVRKVQAVSATLGPAVAAGLQAYRAVAAARGNGAAPASPDDAGGETPPDLPPEVSVAILEQLQRDAE